MDKIIITALTGVAEMPPRRFNFEKSVDRESRLIKPYSATFSFGEFVRCVTVKSFWTKRAAQRWLDEKEIEIRFNKLFTGYQ